MGQIHISVTQNMLIIYVKPQYLVSVWPSESDPSCILYVLTDQGVATSVLQGFLDVWRLVANHIDHQLGSSQFSQLLICWFHL